MLQGIFCLRPGLRNNGHNRLALPARTFNRQSVLRGRLHANQMPKRCNPWLAEFGHLTTIYYRKHTWHFSNDIGVNLANLHMCNGRSPINDMRHAGKLNVINVGAFTFE